MSVPLIRKFNFRLSMKDGALSTQLPWLPLMALPTLSISRLKVRLKRLIKVFLAETAKSLLSSTPKTTLWGRSVTCLMDIFSK